MPRILRAYIAPNGSGEEVLRTGGAEVCNDLSHCAPTRPCRESTKRSRSLDPAWCYPGSTYRTAHGTLDAGSGRTATSELGVHVMSEQDKSPIRKWWQEPSRGRGTAWVCTAPAKLSGHRTMTLAPHYRYGPSDGRQATRSLRFFPQRARLH